MKAQWSGHFFFTKRVQRKKVFLQSPGNAMRPHPTLSACGSTIPKLNLDGPDNAAAAKAAAEAWAG